MKWIPLGFALLAALPVSAQQNPLKNAGKYGNTITADDLKKHLYIVASPEMEGRETASEGERKAAAYIEDHFKKNGLIPANKGSYRQFFEVYRDVPGNSTMEVNGKLAQQGKDFIVGQEYSATQYFSEVVYLKELADTAKYNVAGKAVLLSMVVVNGRSSPGAYQLLRYVSRNGAAAIFTVTQSNLTTPRGGGMYVELYRKAVAPNSITVTAELAEQIAGTALKAGTLPSGPISVKLKLHIDKKD